MMRLVWTWALSVVTATLIGLAVWAYIEGNSGLVVLFSLGCLLVVGLRIVTDEGQA